VAFFISTHKEVYEMPRNETSQTVASILPADVLAESANLTDIQVAELFNCSVSSIRNARSLRKGPLKDLPYTKFGKSVRYCLRDILEFQRRLRIDPKTVHGE
jgi:hypothetical protein